MDRMEAVRKLILEDKQMTDSERLQITVLTELGGIKSHLWWLALWCQVSLVMMVIAFLGMLAAF